MATILIFCKTLAAIFFSFFQEFNFVSNGFTDLETPILDTKNDVYLY